MVELKRESIVQKMDGQGAWYYTMDYNEADKNHLSVDVREIKKDCRMYEAADDCNESPFLKKRTCFHTCCSVRRTLRGTKMKLGH